MDDLNKSNFDISEPTDEEIQKTIQKIQEKENVTLSRENAIKYTKLYEELRQWFLLEKNLESQDSISKEIAEEVKVILLKKQGQKLTEEQANEVANESLNVIISREKDRIASEIKAIILK